MEMYYELKTKLRCDDYDVFDKIKPHQMLSIFQDIATNHAEEIGLGYDAMKQKNLAWVLVSNYVEILGHPMFNEEVLLKTWPKEKNKLDFNREYEICALNGDTYFKGIARWVIIDLTTRKLKRAEDVEYSGEVYNRQNFENIKRIKITIPHNKEFIGTHKVVLNDLDHNGHMNNCKYVEAIFNFQDKEYSQHIKLFQIDYLKECYLNDNIDIFKFEDDKYTYFVGYNSMEESFIMKVGF